MISQHMINENSGDHMVGGPGCSVEVDVALYGLCKVDQTQRVSLKLIFSNLFICYFSQGQRDYHRGLIGERRRLWVLGGIVR